MSRGTTIAVAHWRRLDRQGTDRCTLAAVDHGWILSGQASWTDDVEIALNYAVRCDQQWNTLSADISGRRGKNPIGIKIHRNTKGWTLNDVIQFPVTDCIDLDLSFTPATNLLPLRRLTLPENEPQPLSAAWLVPDLDRLDRLDQAYARMEGDAVAYASPNFKARLTAHSSGFITHYPGLWDGWVDA